MNKKPITLFILAILLTSLAVPLLIGTVKADPINVTINPDGSITQSSAVISTSDQTTYTLTGNFSGSITVQRSNIVLDGSGFTITGGNSGNGIDITSVNGVTVQNVTVSTFSVGIYIYQSSNDTITLDNIQDSQQAISIEEGSCNNTVSYNQVTGGFSGIVIYGYYLYNVNSSNNIVSYNTVSGCSGLAMKFANGACNNTASNNQMSNSNYGFIFDNGISNNILTDNVIISNNNGIYADYDRGVANTITGNTLVCNSIGIYLYSCDSFTIYQNNFIANSQSFSLVGSSSNWDNNDQGNYYCDYTANYPNAQQIGTTGIWDTPYLSTDNYPLMHPYGLYLLNITRVGCGSVGFPSIGWQYGGLYYEQADASVQVTATPFSGQQFFNWILDGQNITSNPLTMVMNSDRTLQALFSTPLLTVESATGGIVTGLPSGTVYPSSPRIDGTTIAVSSGSYNVRAVPDSGYAFQYWLRNGTQWPSYNPSANPTTMSMGSNNYVLQPVFAQQYTVTIEQSTNGVVYDNWCWQTLNGTSNGVNAGAQYIVNAAPNSGYAFAYWLVNGTESSTNPGLTLTVNSNLDLQAVFTQQPVDMPPTLTVSSGQGGTTSPAAGDYEYNPAIFTNSSANAANGSLQYDVTQDGSFVVLVVSTGDCGPLEAVTVPQGFTQQLFVNGTDNDQQVYIATGTQQAGTYSFSASYHLGYVYFSLAAYVFPPGNYSFVTDGISPAEEVSSGSLALSSGSYCIFGAGADYYPVVGSGYVDVSSADEGSLPFSLIEHQPSGTAAIVGYPDIVLGGIGITRTISVTATPDEGYSFSHWIKDSQSVSDNPISIALDQDHALQPVFQPLAPATHSVAFTQSGLSSGTSWSVTLEGTTQTSTTDTLTFSGYADGAYGYTVTTPAGYSVDTSSGTVAVSGTDASQTVTFTQNTYTLTVNVLGTGCSVDLNSSQDSYAYGTSVQLTPVAAQGWTFNGWSGDLSGTDNPVTVIMDGNKTITATFASANSIVAVKTTDNQTYTVTLGGNITAQQMTNMTITPYENNVTTTVAFTVTGPSGEEGYGTITLPKEAIPYGSTPQVYIDGVPADNQSYTSDDQNYYITYSTHFSTHEITIVFVSPEEPTQSAFLPLQLPWPPTNPWNQTTQPSTTEPTSTPNPTVTPTPTSSPTPTPTMTPALAGIQDYIVLSAAVIALVAIAFGLVYKRRRNKWR